MTNLLQTTNKQKVLDFLVKNPKNSWQASEIQKGTKLSKAGVNFALRDLVKENIVARRHEGKTFFYSIDLQDPAIKQLKVLNNIISFKPLLDELKEHSLKIVLFGSTARGEDLSGSDFDLFILSQNAHRIKEIIGKGRFKASIQPILKTPNELIKFEKENPTFAREIEKGIILWEQQET